jgi:hypothetical protein
MGTWDIQKREMRTMDAEAEAVTATRDQNLAEALDNLRGAEAYILVTLSGERVTGLASFQRGTDELTEDAEGLCKGAAEALIALWFSQNASLESLARLVESFKGSAVDGFVAAMFGEEG